jgi:hypothetical protein
MNQSFIEQTKQNTTLQWKLEHFQKKENKDTATNNSREQHLNHLHSAAKTTANQQQNNSTVSQKQLQQLQQ